MSAMWLMNLLYLPFGVIMSIVFWTVVFLIFVVHMLRHVMIMKESKSVFWLSTAFDLITTATIVVLFDRYCGDWPASNEVKLLVMVIAYAVADYLFTGMVFHISDNVAQAKIERAVDSRSHDLAQTIVARRDEKVFQAELSQRLADEVEKKAEALVESRDDQEFNRLRQECLDKLIQRDFDKRLHEALESDAHKQLIARRLEEEKWARSSDTDKALWIALSDSGETLAKHFGVGQPTHDCVFAVPYWVYYDNEDGKPKTLRFNSANAFVVKATDAAFVSNRWNKVDGSNEIVLDGAIIRAPRV